MVETKSWTAGVVYDTGPGGQSYMTSDTGPGGQSRKKISEIFNAALTALWMETKTSLDLNLPKTPPFVLCR